MGEKLTPFQQAFNEWRDEVLSKKKSHKHKFLLSCNSVMVSEKAGPEAIDEAIRLAEAKHAQKTTFRVTKRVLGPVVNVLKDYYTVIESCCQADPTPSSLIWGALKVIINGLGRYFELFEKIRGQLHELQFQLEVLKGCEDLWGDSELMQRYLCRTYVQVFKFWAQVDKECDRIIGKSMLRATTSFSTKKLQTIIDDLTSEVENIEKLTPIVEGRKARGEREDSERERIEARIDREESKIERKENAEFRQTSQQEKIYHEINSWLQPKGREDNGNGPNKKRHQDNLDSVRYKDTCDWLPKAQFFSDWVKPKSQERVLRIYARPGSGKSTLCSHAIAHVQALPSSPALAFQFFHFDQETTVRQLRYNLAAQLLNEYWRRNKSIPDDIRLNTTEASDDSGLVLGLILSLIQKFPEVYIFIDGLDEEAETTRQKDVLIFVLGLSKAFPKHVRLWFSSQDRVVFQNLLYDCVSIDIQSQLKTAVKEYLCEALPGLCNLPLDESTQNWALKELQERADGHFLWATLMIKDIQRSIPSIGQLKKYIMTGLPKDINEYYRRILLDGYKLDMERKYAANLLSIVLFARRRLTEDEVIDAMLMISTEVEEKDAIFIGLVQRLFHPLIVLDKDAENPGLSFCRLFHSTVRDFLIKNPGVLNNSRGMDDGEGFLITESVIAKACLTYLQQGKYSRLLHELSEDQEQWGTATGENIANHYFLTYSAKYWDKHLDDVEGTEMRQKEVVKFLKSPNFITTIQLQSLFVESQFVPYTVNSYSQSLRWLKRVFPEWFVDTDVGRVYREQYRNFVVEWKWFLHRPTCDAHCRFDPFSGQTDRCLWKALGPDSFLSGREGRYESFMLANDAAPQKRLSKKRARFSIDGFSTDGRSFAIVYFQTNLPHRQLPIEFRVETWQLVPGSPPKLSHQQSMSIEHDNWCLYSDEIVGEGSKHMAVQFSPDLEHLRLGSQILAKNWKGDYVETLGKKSLPESNSWYFENFVARGKYMVLVSRKRGPKIPSADNLSTDIELDEAAEVQSEESDFQWDIDLPARNEKAVEDKSEKDISDKQSESNSESESAISAANSSSSEDIEIDSGDEEWTDASTDLEKLGFRVEREDSSASELTASSSENSPDDSNSDTNSDSSDKEISASSTSEEEPRYGRNTAAQFAPFEDSDDNDSEMDIAAAKNIFRKSFTERGIITVFDTAQSPPKQLFFHRHPLPVNMNGSPPVIHPTQPLVVWPLSGGDVIFVDFIANSYFIRGFKTMVSRARHLFIKPSFSLDGKYLHFAALEAEVRLSPEDRKAFQKACRKEKRAAGNDKTASTPEAPCKLSLLVTTHRLSEHKTARSPPHLIHSAEVCLGTFASIPTTRMPLTLTWTPTHLFVTFSRNRLRVIKINLFTPNQPKAKAKFQDKTSKDEQSSLAKLPKNNIYLPDSCRVREMQYYPPPISSPNQPGIVMIGSMNRIAQRHIQEMPVYRHTGSHSDPLPDVTSPAIGLFVSDEDLGGWISEEGRVVEVARRAGGLQRKIEKFDANDDCDVELYLGVQT